MKPNEARRTHDEPAGEHPCNLGDPQTERCEDDASRERAPRDLERFQLFALELRSNTTGRRKQI
jgi:hypothetical protein